ncbi:hypothetical protein AB0395_08885 [Streptosporangium sp. NPDC051023]
MTRIRFVAVEGPLTVAPGIAAAGIRAVPVPSGTVFSHVNWLASTLVAP